MKEITKARGIIRNLLMVIDQDPPCQDLHHRKADRHRFDEVCPAKDRYDSAVKRARKFITDKQKTPATNDEG